MSKKANIINLSLRNGDFAVFVEIPKNEYYSMDITAVMKQLQSCLNLITGEEKVESIQVESVQQNERIQEGFKIRERIPNKVIDVKDLNVKQAITEKALVRCPICGQAHCLAVNSGNKIYVMERDFNKDDFNIIAEFDSLTSDGFVNMCCKPETNKLDYFNDLQSVQIINYDDFAVDNNTEVFCPVCCNSSSFLDWKKAYDEPLSIFETEHLCDVCGGETITKVIKKQKVNKCEKCGYETKYKEE